jgi:GTP-binding protein
MNIKSAQFIKGIVGDDEILGDGIPQVAFLGRSNVGKSSVINVLASQKNLARSSSVPGRTREINFYLINKDFYLVDLPGYGFAHGSRDSRETIQQLIYWYITRPNILQKKVVLIVDANIGITDSDAQMLFTLNEEKKDVIIVANKVDKLKKNDYKKKLLAIEKETGAHPLIPFSAEKKTGINELIKEILK